MRADKALFKVNPTLKYEMSIQIEALFELMHEEKEELENENNGGVPFSGRYKEFVTKEHFDKVDLTIRSLENKAESIVADQGHQRDKQRNHQEEQERFSSSFVLYVTIQIVLLLATVLWQVLSLRNFFI